MPVLQVDNHSQQVESNIRISIYIKARNPTFQSILIDNDQVRDIILYRKSPCPSRLVNLQLLPLEFEEEKSEPISAWNILCSWQFIIPPAVALEGKNHVIPYMKNRCRLSKTAIRS
jgi:hypothetical protein